MSMWRTLAGAATVAAVALLAPPASAAQPGVLVTGDNLPANVDPHEIFDVPMQFYSLNIYDKLYRYEGNPPQLEPWLARVHTVSGRRSHLELQAAPAPSSTTAARSPPTTSSTASSACWRSARRRRAPSCRC